MLLLLIVNWKHTSRRTDWQIGPKLVIGVCRSTTIAWLYFYSWGGLQSIVWWRCAATGVHWTLAAFGLALLSQLHEIIDLCHHWPQDGMDQSKWSIPRSQTLTKSLAKHDRPRTKLQGLWMHNVALCMYCIDVRQATDASMVVEALARGLEKMWEICKGQGKPGPKRILIWESWFKWKFCFFNVGHSIMMLNNNNKLSFHGFWPTEADNTVREAKNNTLFKFLSFLQLQKGLDLTGAIMSRVGHTHSSLGTQDGLTTLLLNCLSPLLTYGFCFVGKWQYVFGPRLTLRSNIRIACTEHEIYAYFGRWPRCGWETWFSSNVHSNSKKCFLLRSGWRGKVAVSFHLNPSQPRKTQFLLDKLDLRSWLGTAIVHVEALTTIRPWKQWFFDSSLIPVSARRLIVSWCLIILRLERAPVQLSGAMKEDASGAHSFLFMRRRGAIKDKGQRFLFHWSKLFFEASTILGSSLCGKAECQSHGPESLWTIVTFFASCCARSASKCASGCRGPRETLLGRVSEWHSVLCEALGSRPTAVSGHR